VDDEDVAVVENDAAFELGAESLLGQVLWLVENFASIEASIEGLKDKPCKRVKIKLLLGLLVNALICHQSINSTCGFDTRGVCHALKSFTSEIRAVKLNSGMKRINDARFWWTLRVLITRLNQTWTCWT